MLPTPETPDPKEWAASPCPNCGAPPVGPYCAACGQRRRSGRLTLRGVAASVAKDAFNLERGLPATLVALTLRPGPAIREYVEGRRAAYTNPVKYLLLFAALGVFITLSTDLLGEHMREAAAELPEMDAEVASRATDLLTRYFNAALLFAVPLLALSSWLFFRGAGFNLAEHLVFNTYVYAQQNAFFLLFVPAFLLLPGLFEWTMLLYFGLNSVYFVWACVGFFRTGLVRGTLLATAVMGVAYVIYYALLTGVLVGVARYGG